jgi:carboxylate-amine ligase
MAARLIDPASGRLIPVRTMLDRALAECRPHALALGCASELEQVRLLAAAGGARRQRALTAANGGLNDLVPRLANLFLPSERDHGSVAVMSAATAYKTTETDG